MDTHSICKINECGKAAFSSMLCSYHYEQNRVKNADPCIVPDCRRQSSRRGMCVAHYKKFMRHGDPLGGQTEHGALPLFYGQALKHSSYECLLWPYGHTSRGYAIMSSNGTHCLVHRRICEEVHGPAPTDKHQAAHSCGNGHKGCVNPAHLSWKTAIENNADKILHGTHVRGERQGSSKLTESDVKAIRNLLTAKSQRELAISFGVSQSHISRIIRGKNWSWL